MDDSEVQDDQQDEDWYQNDLQLAAELGKALLERNRELEAQVIQLQQINNEQNMEIEYITRQLETVRDSSESRMRIYEELDRTSQELEKTNQRLLIDGKTDKQRIEKLMKTVLQLEEKCDDLEKKVDDMKAEEKRLKQKQQKQDNRRAVSLASLREKERNPYLKDILNEDCHWTYNNQFKKLPLNPYEQEIKNLQEAVKQLKAQALIDKRKKEDLETEVSLLWEENSGLEKKVRSLEEDVKENSYLKFEIQRQKLNLGKYCKKCSNDLVELKSAIEKEIEPDEPQIGAGKLVRLESGGSVYGSTESLNKIVPDIQEVSPVEDHEASSVSILDELETQYKNLFKKYEDLVQNKSRRPGSFHESETFDEALHKQLAVSHKEVQTLLKMQKTTTTCDTASSSEEETNLPHYKSLFRDIFATLKQTRIDESSEQPATSPHSAEPKPLA
ncbi:cerebellar degeneration-related protein 2-like [Saccostrea echinata]|uniref:cerebellar degeneration-related protein 2-like n=1 Tax=Saccostrea echinata TaxID=191078 RepID=UPI002A7F3407|nr:cerebellar degeneration-related protein 2-like [Saccostrea echinata]